MRLAVLDTDVFSFFFKNDTRAALYGPDLAGAQPCVSFGNAPTGSSTESSCSTRTSNSGRAA